MTKFTVRGVLSAVLEMILYNGGLGGKCFLDREGFLGAIARVEVHFQRIQFYETFQNLIPWGYLFLHTLDGGNQRSFVVPDDTDSRSIHWAAHNYQTILSSGKDHMTCNGAQKVRAKVDQM